MNLELVVLFMATTGTVLLASGLFQMWCKKNGIEVK